MRSSDRDIELSRGSATTPRKAVREEFRSLRHRLLGVRTSRFCSSSNGVKDKMLERSGNSEANVEVARTRSEPMADGRAKGPRTVAPGATAQNTMRRIAA